MNDAELLHVYFIFSVVSYDLALVCVGQVVLFHTLLEQSMVCVCTTSQISFDLGQISPLEEQTLFRFAHFKFSNI